MKLNKPQVQLTFTEVGFDGLPSSSHRATQIGSRHYFTGSACARDHIAPRYTSSRRCVACMGIGQWRRSTPKTARGARLTSHGQH